MYILILNIICRRVLMEEKERKEKHGLK